MSGLIHADKAEDLDLTEARIRKSKSGAPKGYSPWFIQTPHGTWIQVWRCNARHRIGPYLLRCNRWCRKKVAHQQKHVCSFSLMPNQDPLGIPPEELQNDAAMTVEQAGERISRQITKLAAKLNYSAASVVSDDFKSFIQHVMSITKNLLIEDPSFDPLSTPLSLSSFTFRKHLQDIADAHETEIIQEFKYSINYASLLIDGGTTNGQKFIQFLLKNPYYDAKLPLATFEDQHPDGDGFAQVFEDVLTNALSNGIEVPGLIMDSMSAQWSGIEKLKSNSTNPQIRNIVAIPCLNHILNLVYKEFLQCDQVQPFIDYFFDLLGSIRSDAAVDFLKAKCPTPVTTRWFYIVESLDFMINHAQIINDFLEILDLPHLDDVLLDAYHILKPLYLMSLHLESDSTSLGSVLPLISKVMKTQGIPAEPDSTELENIYEDHDNLFTHNVFCSFHTRAPLDPTILRLVDDIRKKDGKKSIIDGNPKLSELKEAETVELTPETDPNNLPCSQISENLNARFHLSTSMRYEEYKKTLITLYDMSNDAVFEYFDPMENLFESVNIVIEEQIVAIGEEQNEDLIKQAFQLWFRQCEVNKNDREPVPSLFKTNEEEHSDEYWRRMNQSPDKGMKLLSHIAFRILSLMASEAAVERRFSVQRSMFGDFVTHINTQTIHNRFILRSHK